MARPDTAAYLTADEAAAELGVSRATLYAYVSRGKVRSVARKGTRSRLYVAEDVRRMRAREVETGPTTNAGSLEFGGPVLDSAITLISEQALYYRGRDALRLAGAQSLESVATLIWNTEEDPFRSAAAAPPRGSRGLPSLSALRPVDRAAVALAWSAPSDPYAHNFTSSGIAETGARIIRLLTAATLSAAPSSQPIHEQLARKFGVSKPGSDWLRSALVLCADHELNASTFAVRVVASTGASLYRAISAGLAALVGPEHGGMTERTDALLAELLAENNPSQALAARLRRGDSLPGFGHPLYPKGDPRARYLLRRVTTEAPDHPDVHALSALVRAAKTYAGLSPTLDLALSFIARQLSLPAGSALSIFAVGRCVGWIGHALEQYSSGSRIRPRARYTGEHPL